MTVFNYFLPFLPDYDIDEPKRDIFRCMFMKQEPDKSRKQRQATSTRTAKPSCGTLSYIAECRGTMLKTGPTQGTAPPDGVNRIVRK
jgi:hypothetical protein